MHVQLFHNPAPVRIGSFIADLEQAGNFLSGVTLGNQRQDLEFPRGERGVNPGVAMLADFDAGAEITQERPILRELGRARSTIQRYSPSARIKRYSIWKCWRAAKAAR